MWALFAFAMELEDSTVRYRSSAIGRSPTSGYDGIGRLRQNCPGSKPAEKFRGALLCRWTSRLLRFHYLAQRAVIAADNFSKGLRCLSDELLWLIMNSSLLTKAVAPARVLAQTQFASRHWLPKPDYEPIQVRANNDEQDHG